MEKHLNNYEVRAITKASKAAGANRLITITLKAKSFLAAKRQIKAKLELEYITMYECVVTEIETSLVSMIRDHGWIGNKRVYSWTKPISL